MKPSTQRNRRALIVGAVAAGVILLLTYGLTPWLELRRQIARQQEILAKAAHDDSPTVQVRRLRLAQAVPAFEMPAEEDQQRLRFLKSLTAALKDAGLNLPEMPRYKAQTLPQSDLDVKLLSLECQGQCKLEQAFDVLARLYENPYIVSVEQMALECDSDDRDTWRLSLTLSTFVQEEDSP